MKLPDPTKAEALIKRTFEPDVYTRIAHHEKAIWMGLNPMAAKGYYTVIVTLDSAIISTLDKASSSPNLTIDFRSVDNVLYRDTAITFLQEDVALDARHIQIQLKDGLDLGTGGTVDLVAFYEDSRLFYYLYQCWLQFRLRQSLSVYYDVPQYKDDVSRLPSTAHSALFDALAKDFALANPRDYIWKRQILLQMAVLLSGSYFARRLFFDNTTTLDQIVTDFRQFSDLSEYVHADVETVVASVPLEKLTLDMQRVEYANSILFVLARALAGSEGLPQRLNLLKVKGIEGAALLQVLCLTKSSSVSSPTEVNSIRSPTLSMFKDGTIAATPLSAEGDAKALESKSRDGAPLTKPNHATVSTSTFQEKIAEFDHLTVEVLFQLFSLFEQSRILGGTVTVETLLSTLLKLEDFRSLRFPRLVARLADVITQPASGAYGAYTYQYAYVINRLMTRNSDLAASTRKNMSKEMSRIVHHKNGTSDAVKKSFMYYLAAPLAHNICDDD